MIDLVSTTDVAKHAGVSQTTVSRVLNKPDQVRKDTYDKVMTAVNELNYSLGGVEETVPFTANANQVKTIHLVVGSLDDPIFTEATPAIINYAKQQGYEVISHFIAKENESDVFDAVLSSKAQGIVLISVLLNKEEYDKISESNTPVILLNSNYSGSHHSIGLNDTEAGYLAAHHLIEMNHQEIAWVGGTLNNPSYNNRLLGFIQAIQEQKIKVRKKRLVVTETDKNSLFKAFKNLQALKKKPTAIVAATDEIAIQLLDFYQQEGYQIPQDISIVGIGNSEIGQHSSLNLTSVGTSDSLENLGQEAVKRLFDMLLYNQDEAFNVTRDVQFYERKTTALR
ncbi:LacI family DNA-binding transcriptional regulator [Planococcus kocurii]|uniref:LacI family DNA-binding transcriptional regulator n=1 Tax=Planococcus kocurii TaxID=1374 RepID=UPI003D04566B